MGLGDDRRRLALILTLLLAVVMGQTRLARDWCGEYDAHRAAGARSMPGKSAGACVRTDHAGLDCEIPVKCESVIRLCSDPLQPAFETGEPGFDLRLVHSGRAPPPGLLAF